jgi:hypothetical protein
MTRQHPTPRSLIRGLRPSPTGIAAAAAAQDPGPLLQLQAARPTSPPPAPRRHRSGSTSRANTRATERLGVLRSALM